MPHFLLDSISLRYSYLARDSVKLKPELTDWLEGPIGAPFNFWRGDLRKTTCVFLFAGAELRGTTCGQRVGGLRWTTCAFYPRLNETRFFDLFVFYFSGWARPGTN